MQHLQLKGPKQTNPHSCLAKAEQNLRHRFEWVFLLMWLNMCHTRAYSEQKKTHLHTKLWPLCPVFWGYISYTPLLLGDLSNSYPERSDFWVVRTSNIQHASEPQRAKRLLSHSSPLKKQYSTSIQAANS